MRLESSPITVSMTQFASFVLTSGLQQLSVVRRIRRQHLKGYAAATDLYRGFRQGLVEGHRGSDGLDFLDALVAAQSEPARQSHYPELAKGYRRFVGRKAVGWTDPPRGHWEFYGLRLSVRPELGLTVNGKPMAIKLHLAATARMDRRRADILNHLMACALPDLPRDMRPAILDVRTGKLFALRACDPDLDALVHGQALAFAEIYRRLS